jgi:hypothetical protein
MDGPTVLPAGSGGFQLRACLEDRIAERPQDQRLRDEVSGIVFDQEDRLHMTSVLLSPNELPSGA